MESGSRIRHHSLERESSIDTPQKLAEVLLFHDPFVDDDTHHPVTHHPALGKRSSLEALNRAQDFTNLEERISQSVYHQLHEGFAMSPIGGSQQILHNAESNNGVGAPEKPKPSPVPEVSLRMKQFLMMSLWFFCSFVTIFLNKYILSTLDGDPGVLGECQILMTTVFGAIMMYLPCWKFLRHTERTANPEFSRFQFLKTLTILGWMRFGAIVCSVISLKYIAVSFSETIKSSAPLFTVIIAYFLLNEHSGLLVTMSLIPIMVGLSMATLTEISFNMIGFLAGVSNNILDCFQNVFSKKLLIGDQKYSPMELQFYTSLSACIVQMPFWFLFLDLQAKLAKIDSHMAGMLLINSLLFYFQSLSAYLLMSLISPITFSVSGTVKRMVSIWFSVIVFGNKVTFFSGLGTMLVVTGVFFYQQARNIEARRREFEDEDGAKGKTFTA